MMENVKTKRQYLEALNRIERNFGCDMAYYGLHGERDLLKYLIDIHFFPTEDRFELREKDCRNALNKIEDELGKDMVRRNLKKERDLLSCLITEYFNTPKEKKSLKTKEEKNEKNSMSIKVTGISEIQIDNEAIALSEIKTDLQNASMTDIDISLTETQKAENLPNDWFDDYIYTIAFSGTIHCNMEEFRKRTAFVIKINVTTQDK